MDKYEGQRRNVPSSVAGWVGAAMERAGAAWVRCQTPLYYCAGRSCGRRTVAARSFAFKEVANATDAGRIFAISEDALSRHAGLVAWVA